MAVFHIFIFFILLIIPQTNSLFFNFTSFEQNAHDIYYQGDAFSTGGSIQVTKNQRDSSLIRSTGRASYAQPVILWDAASGRLTDFTTHFSFIIKDVDPNSFGDGLAFFLSPFDSDIPAESYGGFLGLFGNNSALNSSENQIVAVEFDTFKNVWDPSPNHVGIDVNSIESVANVTWNNTMKNGTTANAWVSYNSSTMNLSVFLSYAENPIFSGKSSVSYVVDLRDVLPEMVRVGFSAATGDWIEIHTILSWTFNSTLDTFGKPKRKIGPTVGVLSGIGVLISGFGLFWIFWWKKRVVVKKKIDAGLDFAISVDFERGSGPTKFKFGELSCATKDFSEEGKLGEGGFGGVYKGLLSDPNMEVAVKRVSKGSKQGKKEYVSEVKVISRLRHRNLVQLIGWCHEQGEFLLVYEFLPNGSLDSHLFGAKDSLKWSVRHKIALGIASALLYLHEEWEQCVIHRDIKSSNVMLDSNYNAKLGDFGLARLIDHELGSQTTVLAGTMGYLAPECVTTGKASKESDVYSFGVVALEITCGRRPVDPKAEPSKVGLVEWVWDLYGSGRILEAADKGLSVELDEKQIESLMVVGLWCCHPDFNHRPSIKQVINVLNFEAPLPSLPSKLPVPMYYAPPMHLCRFSFTSSVGLGDTEIYRTQCLCSSGGSSISAGSSKGLLRLHETNV